jgi:hypothetical protein
MMTIEQVLTHLAAWCKLYEESFDKPVPLDELATYIGQVCYRQMPDTTSPSEVSQEEFDTYIEKWEQLVEEFYGREATPHEKVKFLTVIEELPG